MLQLAERQSRARGGEGREAASPRRLLSSRLASPCRACARATEPEQPADCKTARRTNADCCEVLFAPAEARKGKKRSQPPFSSLLPPLLRTEAGARSALPAARSPSLSSLRARGPQIQANVIWLRHDTLSGWKCESNSSSSSGCLIRSLTGVGPSC